MNVKVYYVLSVRKRMIHDYEAHCAHVLQQHSPYYEIFKNTLKNNIKMSVKSGPGPYGTN